MRTPEQLAEIAEYFCDLFEQFSVNPPVDRILPEFRVCFDDLKRKYPDLTIHDREPLDPFIQRAMRRRGLSFKRR